MPEGSDQTELEERFEQERRRWKRQRLTGSLALDFQQGVPTLLRKNETEKPNTTNT